MLDSSLVARITKNLKYFSKEELKEIDILTNILSNEETKAKATSSFIEFVKYIWPQFISGEHHKIMAEKFDRIVSGDLKRLIINMPPRHTKSEFASKLLPAYYLGKYPDRFIIQASHTADLSVDFGRAVRNLVDTAEYQKIFPGIALAADSKSAGRWDTNKKGRYYAVGVNGAIAGRGAHLCIIDDPHSEQDEWDSGSAYKQVHDWYLGGPRQRLQPDGAIVIVMTRWNKVDLTGSVIKDSIEKEGSDEWEVIEFPAILPSGRSLWPEYWKLPLLEKLRAELPKSKWNAQYMQNPITEEGAIVKREWWREWEKDKAPEIKYLILSLDPAFTKNNKNDPSAWTLWGVFEPYDADLTSMKEAIILLDSNEEWLEFPDLKKKIRQEYLKWNPDSVLVENTGAGMPLLQELRRTGVPVMEYNPQGRSGSSDKIARLNAVADMFLSGSVWYVPNAKNRKTIEQMAEFPYGNHDDLVDSSTQALKKLREGGFIKISTDYEDTTKKRKTSRKYY